MDNKQIYQMFIGYLDQILLDFEDLRDNCPADFDETLSEVIIRAQQMTERAYGHALAKKEN